MSGLLFTIVGPSGAGKDTLMRAAQAARPGLALVRRVISRPTKAGGEEFDGVSEAAFQSRLSRGDFALHWQAHGLHYGIPADITDRLAKGETLVFNGSRAILSEAAQTFPGLRILHITARPEVLAQRLSERGREAPEDIAARLSRAALPLPAGLNVIEIDNSGALEPALAALLHALDGEDVPV
ncbi:phosphonate metabolism protein/1,5-bisphosphokinase (PRPP-forming) PhnN [Rhodalgimonas zhirmunskyi]|uniref:Ribose 1,5-bisphosphate phosphokinase PhnN n=1 Tax=Rhodalgimonas zhirmunskyi TaxID=2964767 RepID=A0AAJ1UAW1_9RHOB|nr:phosphonate metabolism protein/1,5-bisphosphokinase (PRPP-forming) PhnN [Rhodoalgimonas zhirmunskyi]MDQ2094453.1 phosphonate metabolism protein/1,5-bisphosphokinase (PRPP-forming) PhnN [Rhodoalgimonas zhirmunskyi]